MTIFCTMVAKGRTLSAWGKYYEVYMGCRASMDGFLGPLLCLSWQQASVSFLTVEPGMVRGNNSMCEKYSCVLLMKIFETMTCLNCSIQDCFCKNKAMSKRLSKHYRLLLLLLVEDKSLLLKTPDT